MAGYEAVRRYLVTRACTVDGVADGVDFHFEAKAGHEVDLTPAMAAVVSAAAPGALLEMDARTKTDWENW